MADWQAFPIANGHSELLRSGTELAYRSHFDKRRVKRNALCFHHYRYHSLAAHHAIVDDNTSYCSILLPSISQISAASVCSECIGVRVAPRSGQWLISQHSIRSTGHQP